jgi:voltage-gated potassium channel
MQELAAMRRRLFGIVGAMLSTLAAGTAGYMVLERWSFFDSLYMTVITLGTVGYGETHPLGASGRMFTIFLIMGGIAVMTYALTSITAILVEGDLSAVFARRRMEKGIAGLTGHYIICGASHAGGVICSELHKTGRPFVLVERDKERLRREAERLGEGVHSIEGDATQDETLKRAGVERAAGVFAVLATDQDNAFVALSAKGLNPKVRVVSKQKELGVREKLFRSGADNVVNPEYIGGLRMASEMIRPAAVGFLDLMIRDRGSVVRFEEVAVPNGSAYVGRALSEVKGSGVEGPLLVAVLDGQSGRYEINPMPDRPIKAGDCLVMLGDVTKLSELRKALTKAG